MAIIISHTAIINKQGRILVLQRSFKDKVLPGFWDLPGGTARINEKPITAAIREAKEECGLKIKDLKILACVSNWDKAKQENFITLIFITKKYSEHIKLNPRDHVEYAWLTKQQLKRIKTVKYFKIILNLI